MDPSYNDSFGGTNPGGTNPSVQPEVPVGASVEAGANSSARPGVPDSSGANTSVGVNMSSNVDVVAGANMVAGTNMTTENNVTMGTNAPMGAGAPMGANMTTETNMMVETNMPIGSGNGDIILNNTPQKKTNKIVIIVLVTLVGLLVLAGILFLIFGRGGGKVSLNTQNSFNRYANYFLYGEDKTDKIEGEFNEENEPYFQKAMLEFGSVERDEYLANLKQYYESFYNQIKETEQEDESVSEWIEEYNTKFVLVTSYYGGAVLDQSDLLEAYVLGGEDSVYELITDKLSPYADLGEIFEIDYYNTAIEMARDNLDYIMAYESAGCLANGQIDYSCAVEKNVEGNNSDIVDSMNENYWDLLATINNSEYSLYSGIYGYRNMIYGEGESSNATENENDNTENDSNNSSEEENSVENINDMNDTTSKGETEVIEEEVISE